MNTVLVLGRDLVSIFNNAAYSCVPVKASGLSELAVLRSYFLGRYRA